MSFMKPVDKEKADLKGPYECSGCNGHVMLDVSYLEQVYPPLWCPYCKRRVAIKDA